jgi:Fe2+ transport system protein FeoA
MQTPTVTPLSDVFGPGVFHCHDVAECGEASVRLKRFGICAGREIEVIQAGNPMVIRVCGVRVGVSRELSEMIVVEEPACPLHAAGSESMRVGGC